ncbi:MAG: bifunctional phosphoglucose/phosphomannose isomerase [Solirubrobacterales bacterium]
MRDAVMAMPDHLRDAIWRIESARLSTMEAPAAIVCGMGGSAIGGDLGAAALGDRLSRPMFTMRGYELPAWAPAGSAVLCSSYSGDTEETLACYDAAEALGAQRLVATTGGELAEAARRDGVPVIGLPAGLQPRGAVAYMFCSATELAVLAMAASRIHTEIDAAAAHLEENREAIAARAAQLAEQLGDATVVISGSDLTAPIAYRWKCELNENAKVHAFSSTLPEANHNELVGWSGASEHGGFASVLLEDRDQHPRERRRIELTAELVEGSATSVVRLEADAETRTARLFELVLLGDLLSLEIAERRGVDAWPVEVIDSLKSKLGPL